jgi:hypothetical protein
VGDRAQQADLGGASAPLDGFSETLFRTNPRYLEDDAWFSMPMICRISCGGYLQQGDVVALRERLCPLTCIIHSARPIRWLDGLPRSLAGHALAPMHKKRLMSITLITSNGCIDTGYAWMMKLSEPASLITP